MGSSLHEEVARFKAWAANYHPIEGRSGEWECNYAHWQQLNQSFTTHLDSCPPQTSGATDILDILYAIGRDNEMEELVEELANRSEWFMFLLPHALLSDDADVRWQFAKQLGNGNFEFIDAESALMKFVEDDKEYVSRMALRALGQIGSSHAEDLCERAWESGHEYQRIMALWVLKDIKSPKLARYLSYAKEDGRNYVVSNAAEIAQGTVAS
ncbi:MULTISPECIES: HEAT repeat domain-containing protein [unclassified Janthinobacterium]|uniref:HEAT repeat domain-containing protein n=1 Tax=unclassified Janthinobacterium TaxID=2610881 RepID=UPI002712DD83|nr:MULTISPECIES: HEAT repeat domain-containing protein [unclassified Janthinobacterium]MDO8067075.1 HEAT repeat domain-containing protein [Janthinobacterium sp. SUN206]MDO8070471.1 HEAT repeat domain-containing protein [Janthinobacterium sp. SUN176]